MGCHSERRGDRPRTGRQGAPSDMAGVSPCPARATNHGIFRRLADRRGRWLGDPLTAITMLASLTDQAGRMIPELAAQARKQGASWAGIATALGTSPEQAELQYSRRSPVRDTREPCDPD
jgi:hypothetical protein